MLALKEEVGRKDRLPHLLATISVGIKRNRFSWTETSCCAPLVSCITLNLLELSHYQAKRNQKESKPLLI